MTAGDRRVHAFVSSRMQELTAERRVVKRALDQLGVQAWVFEEDAGARPTTIRQTYLDELSKSDLYIGLFWKSWGKYTIEEFRHARQKLRMDCLIYEKRASGTERETDLQQFLDDLGRVGSGITIQRFSDQQELDSYVRRDVAGWQAEKIHERGAARLDSPFQAPPLGDSYIARGLILEDLKRCLLPGPDGQEKRVTRAILHGPPGVGKTIMASAFANDEDVGAAFPDGVLWLSLGETPDLLRCLTEWGRAASDPQVPTQGYPDIETAVGRLRSLMRDRAYLLVVDDVWMPEHVEQGFLIGGPRCLLLVTSRDGRIASKIRAERIELTPMTEKEAVELMSRWAGPISQEDEPIARTLAREVGYLPLALELIGARVGSLASWPAYRERWKEQRLTALTRGRGSQGRQDSVSDSLELSLKLLPESDRQRYIRLGVFERKSLFPASAAATLWSCHLLEAEDLLIDFAGQALLSRRQTDSGIRFGFHDLLHDFTLEQMGRSGVLHAHETVLAHYRQDHADWPSVPDDGYILNQLSYHLIEANRGNELLELLIGSPSWMNAKITVLGSDSSLMADVGRALALDLDEVQLAALYAVRQAVKERLGWLTDTDLERLAWQGRVAALSQARMRPDPQTRCESLITVYQGFMASGDPRPELLDEAEAAARQIGEGVGRAGALQAIGLLRFSAKDDRWSSILEEARHAADTAERASGRCQALLNLADALHAINQAKSAETLDAAFAAAVQVPSNDDRRVNMLRATALAYARTGRPKDALQVLDAYEPYDPERLFSGGERYRLPDDIIDVLVACHRSRALTPSLTHRVSELLSREDSGQEKKAIRRLSLFIRALTGDREAYDTVVNAGNKDPRMEDLASKVGRCLAASCAESGDFEGARQELQQIRYRSDMADALEDIVQSASKAGYSGIGEIVSEAAPRQLPEENSYLKKEQLPHTIRAWRLLFRVGRPEDALELISMLDRSDKGRVLIELLPEFDHIDVGNRRTFLEEAGGLAREVGGGYRYTETLRALALAFAKIRDERADSIWEEAWASITRSDRSPFEYVRGHTVTRRDLVLMDAAEVFAVDESIQSSRQIIDSLGIQDRFYYLCRLTAFLFDRGDKSFSEVLEETLEMAREIEDDDDLVNAMIMLVSLLGHVKDPRWRELTREAESLALNLSNSSASSDFLYPGREAAEALAHLTDILAEIKQFDEALRIAGKIPRRADRAQRLAHIAAVLDEAGDSRSNGLFKRVKKTMKNDRHYYDPGEHYQNSKILLFALIEAGRFDEAMELARMDFPEPSYEWQNQGGETLGEVNRMLIQAGRLDDAWEITHSIVEPSTKARALVDLALALADLEPATSRTLIDEVRDLAQFAELPDRQSSILYQTVRGLAWMGRISDAEMVAGKIVYRDFRAGALQYIAGTVRKTDPARADELLRQALAESHLISDASLRHRELMDLADTMARVHGLRRGLEVLECDSLDEFVGTLVRWAPLLKEHGAQPSSVLCMAIAIAAWVRHDWKDIHDRLIQPGAPAP